MLKLLSDLSNLRLHAEDGDIGRCKDFLIDDTSWVIRYMVADTHAWLPGGKRVLISPISLQQPDWREKRLPVTLSKAQIKDSPDIDEHASVSREYEQRFFDYYSYTYYWIGIGMWGTYSSPQMLAEVPEDALPDDDDERQEHQLRSYNEMNGYSVSGVDGSIGHVDDLVVNEQDWSIAHLIIDTRDWLPGGKKILLNIEKIVSVSWGDKTIKVEVPKSAVEKIADYRDDKSLMAEIAEEIP